MIKYMLSTLLLLPLIVQSQLLENTPLITSQGEATVYVEPDEALFTYTITTEGEDLRDARDRNAKISKSTIDFLKKQGVKPEHIQTQYLNVGLRYRNHKVNPNDRYYAATQTISVCLRELDKYESVMMGLLEMEITSLNSPVFRTTDYRAKKDEARLLAMQAAREKATAMAGALGQEIGAAYSINEQDLGYQWRSQNAYANVTMESQGSESIEGGLATGQLEIKAKVAVSFHLIQ